MSTAVFLRTEKPTTLKECAEEVQRLIGCREPELRHSDNYPDSLYYHLRVFGISIIVSLADEGSMPEFNFKIVLRDEHASPSTDASFTVQMGDRLAKCMVRIGYLAAIPQNYGVDGSPIAYYS